jgi:hypothetical protein
MQVRPYFSAVHIVESEPNESSERGKATYNRMRANHSEDMISFSIADRQFDVCSAPETTQGNALAANIQRFALENPSVKHHKIDGDVSISRLKRLIDAIKQNFISQDYIEVSNLSTTQDYDEKWLKEALFDEVKVPKLNPDDPITQVLRITLLNAFDGLNSPFAELFTPDAVSPRKEKLLLKGRKNQGIKIDRVFSQSNTRPIVNISPGGYAYFAAVHEDTSKALIEIEGRQDKAIIRIHAKKEDYEFDSSNPESLQHLNLFLDGEDDIGPLPIEFTFKGKTLNRIDLEND